MQGVRRLRERVHDHLERNDHRKNAQIVYNLAGKVVNTRNEPCRHRSEQQNHRRGQHRDHEAEERRLPKRIVAVGHAADIVVKPAEAVSIRENKGRGTDGGLQLEGVYQHDKERRQIDHRNQRHNHCADGKTLFCHYC